jgi:glycosyltransferase involved in cell wall biosynthesis
MRSSNGLTFDPVSLRGHVLGRTKEKLQMRIALIAPPWLPIPAPTYGGTEAVVDNLARGLLSRGHDVLLFTTGESTCPVPRAWLYDRALGVGAPGPTAEARHVINAYDNPFVVEADVVHDHTIVGPLYAVRAGLVTTAHGPFTSECGDVYRVASRRSALVAISQHQADSMGDVGVAAVIHHGLDVEAIPAGDGTGGYALFLGRMHPDKGVASACRIALDCGLPLVIAAKMDEQLERDYFDSEVRPLLGPGIEYIGEVGGDEKWELLGDAVCLLNPIEWAEPFGMVMIEALACGTPIVTTPLGSVPEIVTDGVTGVVGTASDLCRRLLDAKDIDRGRCRQEVLDRFTTDRMVDRHVDLYTRVASGAWQGEGRGLDRQPVCHDR